MAQLLGYLAPCRGEHAAPGTERAAAPGSQTNNWDASCTGEFACSRNGVSLAVKGRPIWKGKLLAAPSPNGALEEICDAYLQRGERLIDQIDGHFALALAHPASRSCLLVVDRMGVERITYAALHPGLVFGTSAFSVSGHPQIGRRVRNQALYDFLFMHMVPAPDTVYENVHKLPPAHLLSYRNGKVSVHRYWQPTYHYEKNEAALAAELKGSLAQAVAAAEPDEASGAFLSGGLDSSTVAGVLAQQTTGGRAKTFSVGFAEEGYDELQYARIASSHFGCDAREYYVTLKDIVDSFMRIAEAYDEPFGNSSAVPTYCCAKFAADNGVRHLLAGDGGDELFAGNERYAKQKVFSLFDHVPGLARRFLLHPLTQTVDPEHGLWPLRKLKSYVDQASIPLPDRFESWNFVFREGRSRLLDPTFSSSVDTSSPLRVMRQVWQSAPSDNLIEKMLWYDWHFTLADNDLRKVGAMCELAGVRVSYPMLHSAVVDLSTRVPPSMKMRGLELRSFFRRAMSGFLPPATLDKKKHGFGLPFGVWLKKDKTLGDLIYSLLSDLGRRSIISAEFLASLIEEHRKGHAAYYGYIIWDLAMLEAWLSRKAA